MKDLWVKIIRGVMILLSRFPLKFHYFMGDVLSWLVMNVFRYRSDVVMINLARAFPEKKVRELKSIYKDYYRHLGEIVAEAVWFGGCSYSRLRREGIVELTNPDTLADVFARAPSVTMLSSHCGNWELLGGLPGYVSDGGVGVQIGEESFTVVYKPLRNTVSDRVFALNRIAPLEKVGLECEVKSGEILRYSIRHKDEKRIYIYPADQYPYGKAGRHPVGEFMNQPTYAMAGSVGVACKLSHAVVYLKMRRVRRGRYEMSFIPLCENASEVSSDELIRKYYDQLEEEIRETPANWLWSHNRWK